MTQLLERAWREVGRLSEAEQDEVAAWILAELESEQRWDTAFAQSPDVLESLAAEAMADHEAGRTELLDPETL